MLIPRFLNELRSSFMLRPAREAVKLVGAELEPTAREQ